MKTLLIKPTMAAVLTAAIGLTLSGQAAASVYARSYLELTDFSVVIGPTAAPAQTYSFDLTNTARLNGNSNPNGLAGCGGIVGGATTCNPVGDVLPSPAANAPGNFGANTIRANNTFDFKGPNPNPPGGKEYANSASTIHTAQLVNGTPTSTEQIAEAELHSGESAGSSAEINSQTTLLFQFSLADPGSLTITFDALLDQMSRSDTANAITDQSDSSFTFTLQENNGTDNWTWSSNGLTNAAAGCGGNLGCTELDPFDLNGGTAVSGIGLDDNGGPQSGSFSAGTGLGTLLKADTIYTLTLNSVQSTSVRQIQVPEPSSLLLLGAGLLGAGFKKRHNIAKLIAQR